jgi:WD40 repeat protein
VARFGLLAALGTFGCSRGDLVFRPPAILEIPHAGDRSDAPRMNERGNAAFAAATFDDNGQLLVTAIGGGAPFWGPVQVWDAQTGHLLTKINTRVPTNLWMIDSRRQRLLGTSGSDLHLFDLRTGRDLATLPHQADAASRATGLAADGSEVLIFKPGWLEVWHLDPPGLARRAKSPLPIERYFPGCVGGIPFTYNDKSCWEWSPDRRTLALAYTPVYSPLSESHFVLIDIATLEARELRLPTERKGRTLAAFAFSPDAEKIAIGTDEELLIYDRAADRWGPTILGDHKRNRFLGAMRFTPDGRRVIALGDLAQVSVYDVSTGERVGRHDPLDWDQEAVFRVSRDGSRIVLYHFVSDTFEVLDGRDARRLGWVCPYFCNAKHNPIEAPYALSPDGRSVAVSHTRGTAVWDVASDSFKFALHDPERPPLQR